jgi:hypothetical protein
LINQLAEENKPVADEDAPTPPSNSKPNPPRPTPPPPPPSSPILTPEVVEVFDDEDFDVEEESEMPQPTIQRNDGVEKLKINFDDNPLRANTRREPPPATIAEETFIKGGEIKDDLSI